MRMNFITWRCSFMVESIDLIGGYADFSLWYAKPLRDLFYSV
jgi:hypothetical protein